MKTEKITQQISTFGIIAFLLLVLISQNVTAALTWKVQASPTYTVTGTVNQWTHVVWGATAPNGSGGSGLFVTVAATGGVITSPDGTTWTIRSAPGNTWNSVTWSPSLRLFVAVAYSGAGDAVMTSPDGVTWTARNTGVSGFWLSVTWAAERGIFVAVGYPGGTNNMVMTSSDGINWTGRTAPANSWNSITWAATAPNGSGGSGLFVAVAQSGAGNRVMTSPDGITWTSRTSASDNLWNDVTWSPSVANGIGGHGLFVAVNADGSSYRTMTSPDGVSWTGNTVPVPGNDWYAINWADSASNGSGGYGLFVAVGYSNGTGQEIMTSPDGINWTAQTNPADADYGQNYTGLAWSHALNLFVAFDYSTNTYMTSPNGVIWTDHTPPSSPAFVDATWQSVTWAANAPNGSGGQGLFVSVAFPGSISDQVMTSADGTNWTARAAAAALQWTSVAWSPTLGIYAAVAQSGTGNRVMTSPDGITWTGRSSSTDNSWQSVTWASGLGLFVAVSNTGSGNCVMTSPDGITWTTRSTPPANNDYNSITWSPSLGLLVAVGGSGTGNRVMTSPDGITWTLRATPADNNWLSVTWAATAPNGSGGYGLFAAVATSGTGNRVMTSPDGVNWTTHASPADNDWQSVTWAPELGLFVAVAEADGYIFNPSVGTYVMTSPDGRVWTLSNDAINNYWHALAWSPKLGIFASVANNSSTLLSSSNIGDFIMTTVADSPVISAVSTVPDTTSATITWTTSTAGNSQVLYGLSTGYGSSTTPDTSLFAHSVIIHGLSCNTVYHFQIAAAFAGLTTHSADYTFTTLSCPCAVGVITGAGSLCAGATTTFTDTSAGGTWSSGTLSVAAIGSSTGIVSAVSAGVAVITYTHGSGCTATTVVTVNAIPGGISGPGSVCAGAAIILSDAGGGTWSSGSALATAGSSSGVITGVSSGVATITYTISDGCTTTAAITVNPLPSPVSGVSSLCTGASAVLTDAGSGAWFSGSPGIATIGSSTGIITGVAAGTATITYSLSSGCSALKSVTVNAAPSAISGTGMVCVGSAATLTDAGGGNWTSGSPGIATIGSASGIVTGISPGVTGITYMLADGCTATAAVTVNPLPSSISGIFSVCTGSATLLGDAGGGVWSITPVGVASIGSASGLVTGITAGTATVTYTLATGCIQTAVVTVNALPPAISGGGSLFLGSSVTLTDAAPGGSWSSGSPLVITVGSASGIATGLSAGITVITYLSASGCAATVTLTVSGTPAPVSGVRVLCAGTTVAWTDSSIGGIWSSSDPAIASVGSAGTVTGVSGGTATISYTISGSAACC